MATKQQKILLLQKYGDICFYDQWSNCGGKFETVDHYRSVCEFNGKEFIKNYRFKVDDIENLRPACKKCNFQKKNKKPEEFIKLLVKENKMTELTFSQAKQNIEDILKNRIFGPTFIKDMLEGYDDKTIDNKDVKNNKYNMEIFNKFKNILKISIVKFDGVDKIECKPLNEKYSRYFRNGAIYCTLSKRLRLQFSDEFNKEFGFKDLSTNKIMPFLNEKERNKIQNLK